MKNVNYTLMNADDSMSQTSTFFDMNQIIRLSAHIFFGDATATGSVKLQASNDLNPQNQLPSLFVPINWVDIPTQSASITSGSSALLTLTDPSYRWLRAVYTSVSGGTTTITINLFGVSV